MSTTPFSVTSTEAYTMFDITVTDAAGNTKEFGAQAGGGRLTAQQMANEIQNKNLFPGAQKVVVRPSVSPVPQMTIQKRIEAAQKAGLKRKIFTTPAPEVAKMVKPTEFTVAEAEIPAESRTPSGDPVPDAEVSPAPTMRKGR
jgi:hypothetical protein